MKYTAEWVRWVVIGFLIGLVTIGTYHVSKASPSISNFDLRNKDSDQGFDRNLALLDDPIHTPSPPSSLLAAGTTDFSLSVQSSVNTTCAYYVGDPRPYSEMIEFDQTGGTTNHTTVISGINPDPNTVNHVYIRCASQPEFVLELLYRAIANANPSFPRKANLWGWKNFLDKDASYMARTDLWVAWEIPTPEKIAELRALNPEIRVLTTINAVKYDGAVPDSYYLRQPNGDLIEAWPGIYRLNLAKPEVGEFLASYAYQTVLDSGMMADGVFFDNVFTTQSWLTHDVYGNEIEIDAINSLGQPIPDGHEDDPAMLDTAWKAGIFHELDAFRQLLPNAIAVGHSMKINESGIPERFNGVGTIFWTARVLQEEIFFADAYSDYNDWLGLAKTPQVTMIESSPLDEISYGYGYQPWENNVPPSTLEFSRTYYPWVRFGLAYALMNDGYFFHDFGDMWHGQDWWYDELDFDLGYPLGPATRLDMGLPPPTNLIENGDFESPIQYPWFFWYGSGSNASYSRDISEAISGTASARINVTLASGEDSSVEFSQKDRSLQQDVTYDLTFWAKSSLPRSLTVTAIKGSYPYTKYGLWRRLETGTDWQKYSVTFEAKYTASDAKIIFGLGEETGTVWLDDVRLYVRPPDVYRRDYTNGLVLLNATQSPQTIDIGTTAYRLLGNQAPMVDTILDDSSSAFSKISGSWSASSYDSGIWEAYGPYYHDWGDGCKTSYINDVARWDLPIDSSGIYTIEAWWPDAPGASSWNPSVKYEVIANGQVIAESTLSHRIGGDEWNYIADVQLSPGENPYLKITCLGSGACIADAIRLYSQMRYNDGSQVEQVTLQPMDGIVLRWNAPERQQFLPLVIK